MRWWPARGDSASVSQDFCHGLKIWGQTSGRRQANGRSISEVVGTLITHRATALFSVYQLLADIITVFGEHIAMPMLQLLKSEHDDDRTEREREPCMPHKKRTHE